MSLAFELLQQREKFDSELAYAISERPINIGISDPTAFFIQKLGHRQRRSRRADVCDIQPQRASVNRDSFDVVDLQPMPAEQLIRAAVRE